MLNPFVQLMADEKGRRLSGRTGESIAEMVGHSIDTSTPHPSMGLWVGKLLIRMGQKLAKQEPELQINREKA